MSDLERAARALAKSDGYESDWRMYVPGLRAALAELREPSEAVVQMRPPFVSPQDARQWWRAMIDTILMAPQP